MSDSILQILHLFSHESDLRVAVENCSLHRAPRQHSASQHSPRQTSDAGFKARILKAGRRLHTLDVVSQPSRTFESCVRAETRPTSSGHCLNGGCEFMTAICTVLRAKRATETSKRAFSMRHGAFGRRMRHRNRRACSNRRARAELRETSVR